MVTLRLDNRDVVVSVAGVEQDEGTRQRILGETIDWFTGAYEDILTCCADNLLAVKNESWADAEDEKVTPGQFRERLRPLSVEIAADGSLRISFFDGGLFEGHLVVVATDAARNLQSACLEG